jgi:hypothetical protein
MNNEHVGWFFLHPLRDRDMRKTGDDKDGNYEPSFCKHIQNEEVDNNNKNNL